MKLYLIGGLGADHRVFNFLKMNCETAVIEWMTPTKDQEIESYCEKLLEQIDQEEEFGILGVSFGGIIAVELAKISDPSKVILVSSVEEYSQLPRIYVTLGKMGLLNLIPDAMIKPPNYLLTFLFGASNKVLLKNIVQDTDPLFIRWALGQIVKWKNTDRIKNLLRIHGTHDRLIPLKGEAIEIHDGKHFMIVDKAMEISTIVNRYIGS